MTYPVNLADRYTSPYNLYPDYSEAKIAMSCVTGGFAAMQVFTGTTAQNDFLNPSGIVSFSADNSTNNTLNITGVAEYYRDNVGSEIYMKVDAKSGSTLSYSFEKVRDEAFSTISIVGANGTLISSTFSNISPTIINPPLPADGEYYITVSFASNVNPVAPVPAPYGYYMSITSTDTMVPLPVVAYYDQGGGVTGMLQGCPKLLLPIFTEANGVWYSNKTDAQAVVTADTSNCVGYNPSPSAGYTRTFTATDGGSTLDLNGTLQSDVPLLASNSVTDILYGSVSLQPSSVLSVAYTVSSTTVGTQQNSTINVYDQNGAFVDSASFLPGAATKTFNITIGGKYLIECKAFSNIVSPGPSVAQVSADFIISSDKALSVNPIQALYDVGLTCPARVYCP